MALIGGTIVTWLQNTLKFLTPSARARTSVTAVDGAVVSNPTAKNTTWRSGLSTRDFERVERRVHEPHVGAARLGLEEVALRPGHPHHVAERREDDAGLLGQPHRVVDAAHRDDAHRAPGPVHQLDGFGQQVLDAVPVDGVGVPAAHLHELELVAAGQLGDGLDQRARGGRVPELVDESHCASTLSRQAISDALNASISLT